MIHSTLTMKIASLLIAYLAYSVSAETEHVLDKDKEECVKELNLNREEMIKFDAIKLPPDDNNDFNKFVACESKKKGLMSGNGEILFDAIETLLTTAPELKHLSKVQLTAYKSIMHSAVSACKSVAMVPDSPGKNMIHVHACVYNELMNIKKSLETQK